MKKKITKKIKQKIAKYGALSALLAGAVNAQGQIIYTDVDPDFNGGIGSNYSLDLDNNGTEDFNVNVASSSYYSLLQILTTEANNGAMASSYSALVLSEGDNISSGASAGFGTPAYMASVYSSSGSTYCYGSWCDQTEKFLGFQFDIGGNTHYGWARLSTLSSANNQFTVMDYAYNSQAGAPILAGEMPAIDQVPTALCADFTTMLDENGMATIESSNVDGGSSDLEGPITLSLSQENFSCAEIGAPQTVVLTATDLTGQISTCDALVTVVDEIAPIFTCAGDNTVEIEEGSSEFETPDYAANGMVSATDNCTSPVVITQNPVAGTMLPVGLHTITFTGMDASGNQETCSFDLTIEMPVGILDQNISAVEISPNPASNFIQLNKPANLEISNVEIFDVAGKLIKTVDLSENVRVIDISQLQKGLYLFVFQNEEGSFTKKVVKQ